MDNKTTTGNLYFWKKKVIVSYVLAILVFWIHSSSFANYGELTGWISIIQIFFQKIITPVAVPLFPEFLSILVTLWISTSRSNIFQNLVELNSHCSYNQRKRKKQFFFGGHSAKHNEEVLYFRASQSLE